MVVEEEDVKKEEKMEITTTPSPSPETERMFTAKELSKYDGNSSTMIYLAVLGEVYDVSEGSAYYGPGQGYSCFAGRDGSRAFVTGNFTREGARADLDGLTPEEVAGVIHWRDFYRKEEKYVYVGKLIGLYYDENGNPRAEVHESVEKRLNLHKNMEATKKVLESRFPKCSSKWTQKQGKSIWCEDGRVPRKFTDSFGSRTRCACVRPEEEIESEIGKFVLYSNCGPKDSKCYL